MSTTALVIAGNPVDILQVKADSLPVLAGQITITDQPSYDLACRFRAHLKDRLDERAAHHAEVTAKAHAAWQAALAARHADCDPINAALKMIAPPIIAWEDGQARLEAERQAEARRTAEQQAVAEQQTAALEAIDAGATEAEVEAIISAPVIAPVIAPPVFTRPSGQTTRTTWKARLKGTTEQERQQSMLAVLRAVVASPSLLGLVDLNQSAANKMAAAQKSLMAIPGLEAYPEKSLSGRVR